jgi:hypothetical protein
MTLAFFIVAVAVAALFEWQRRRQKLEMKALCAKLGVPGLPPASSPRILEVVLTVYVGLTGIVFGGLTAWASLESSGVLRGQGQNGSQLLDGSYQIMIILVGGGAALLVLGIRAWHTLRRWQKHLPHQ